MREAKAETGGREQSREDHEFFIVACLATSLIQHRQTCPKLALSTVVYAIFHQLTKKKMPHKIHSHRPIWGRQFLSWNSFFSGFVSSWQKLSITVIMQIRNAPHLYCAPNAPRESRCLCHCSEFLGYPGVCLSVSFSLFNTKITLHFNQTVVPLLSMGSCTVVPAPALHMLY